MKYLKYFEKVTYKDGEQYDWEFDFKIGDPVKFLKDELNGWKAPDLIKDVYFIQNRSDNISKTQGGLKHNYYLLCDINDITLSWTSEENIRLATEEEVKDARIAQFASKYNI